MLMPMNILAPYKGVIKSTAIVPGMHVDVGQILYILLDATAQGNVQRPLRSEYEGFIKTVLVSNVGTVVQRGQVLAEIELSICFPRYQRRRVQQQNGKDRRANRRLERIDESTESASEMEKELEAWKAYRWRYPHHRFY